MLSWWCLIWCTLARCSTGAPDTTTSSSPTSGARDTSGLKKTSRWRQQSFLIQPLRWKYYWNHKKYDFFQNQSSERRRRQAETTTEADATTTTTETITTTEIPTTTAEPLPYSLHYLMVPSVSYYNCWEWQMFWFCFQSVVYLIRPNLKVEGSYPFIIPVYDQVIAILRM